jgi:hypothetical protein
MNSTLYAARHPHGKFPHIRKINLTHRPICVTFSLWIDVVDSRTLILRQTLIIST